MLVGGLSKQIYPNNAIEDGTLMQSTTSMELVNHSMELIGSRENIEEAKDIGVTQISIKVD